MSDQQQVHVTVTRSAGDDRAVLILIDTDFEPDASDGGPGLRVLINDGEAFVGPRYDFVGDHEAKSKSMMVTMAEIPYVEGGGDDRTD